MADKPVTREEKYLAYLTGDYKGELPKPITRKEKYLYELCLKGIGGEIPPEEIKNAVNEYLEKNPVKPGATTEQAQQIEQNKTDVASLKEKTSSLKEDLTYVTETIYGDNFLKTLETVKTELYYEKHAWFIPLNLYSKNDTMLFYFPTLSDGSYQTYLCDESKVPVQNITVVVKGHYSTVKYPNFGKKYAYLRMYAEKSTDVCYIKKNEFNNIKRY